MPNTRSYKKPYRGRLQDRPLVRKPQRYCRSCDNKVMGLKTRCWECEDLEYKYRMRLKDKQERVR